MTAEEARDTLADLTEALTAMWNGAAEVGTLQALIEGAAVVDERLAHPSYQSIYDMPWPPKLKGNDSDDV